MLSHGSVTASHLSSPRGLKQKRKRMRLAGRPVSELRPPPAPGQWTSERASGGASRPGRAREEAGGGAAEVGPCRGGSGAAESAPSPRCCCCCCCCSDRRRRRAKGRSRGLQCGLGVESFTAISRNASAPRGKLCARSSAGSPPGGWGGPGKTTGLYPPIKAGITCPTPTSVKHADIWVKSYKLNSRERYVCNSGFKRKAGTSSLTECVFNKTVNIAQWTTPNLKCIRDPSLTHQRPPSTAAPTGVTPEPDSPNPSGKEPAFTSRSDTTVATRLATGPGSRLMPSKAPSAGTTGVVNNEPSQVPAQTTAKPPEHTPSASQDPPGAYQYNPTAVTAAISTSVAVLCGVCVVCLLPAGHWSEPGSQKPTDDTGPIHRKPIQKERRLQITNLMDLQF
ncbi:interleukin-15 receptor subunit alpha isoform X5 [Neophocaena asiaeorientalis asiaeorientalis]|uniref:Interleukin-15 receptor subunit alpha n=1 Tax=Neophocaena asiaeorientalis asiaeorientalis TaxID=1706337 RepID=A0A341AFZ7_NEOAA|nr:interleukin-15 receptor subunit alpha isoform X5 [Neophocaena asiaeorientalis asiaeorientalis]